MTDDHGEIRTSRVECRDGVLIAIHHFGGGPTPLLVLAALGFPSKAYLPLVSLSWEVRLRGCMPGV